MNNIRKSLIYPELMSVKKYRIEELCEISRGRVISKDYISHNEGKYPVYSSQTDNEGELGKISTFDYDGEYITWTTDGANAGTVFFRTGKFNITNVCGLLKVKKTDLLSKYLYYVLMIEAPKYVHKGMGNPKLMSNEMGQIKVKIPPLESQKEIVNILDNITELTTELTADLTSELAARKQQYSYFLNYLLTFNQNVPRVTLGEIATDIYRGSGITKEQLSEEGYPCVRYGEIYTKYNTWFKNCYSKTKIENISSPKFFEHGDILFAITGEKVEDIAKSVAYMGHEKCIAGGDIVVLKHEQNPRYLAYALSTTDANKQKSKGKIKSKVVHSSVPSIKDIKIPLPSLREQERLANILDNFKLVCEALYKSLTAEIDERKKQLDYYRDKLLSFNEIEN